MRTRTRYKSKFKKRSRLEIVKSWMTSFALTASAVIVAVITIPSSPSATINQLQVFQNEIVYQIEVTDQDHALTDESLVVVLQNQFEHYEFPLVLGLNVGIFIDLTDGATYRMHVMGDKGFGPEKLASRTVETKPSSGGAIVSYQMLDDIGMHFLNYELSFLIYDELDAFSQIDLYYGLIYSGEESAFDYEVIPVDRGASTVTIENIPNYNTTIHIYLEATLKDSQKVRLDELIFNTPFVVEAYAYIEQITDTSASFVFYPDMTALSDTSYMFTLIKDNQIMETIVVDTFDDLGAHMESFVVFDQLKKGTSYSIEFSISYINPYTKVTEENTIEVYEIVTLSEFTYEIEIIEFDAYYEILITVNDPNHHFQNTYYNIYEIKEEFNTYVMGEQLEFIPFGDIKTSSFIIYKIGNPPLLIEIGIINSTVYYYYIQIEETFTEE